MGRCCVCNKEVDFWHSNQLKDGEICDECYVALNQIDNTMDKLKLSKSKCDDIVDVVSKNSDLNNANDKEGDIRIILTVIPVCRQILPNYPRSSMMQRCQAFQMKHAMVKT